MINLPIFRGLKLGTKNEYVEGYLEEHNTSDFYISLMPNKIDAYKIDISTLSIHFPDMLDSKGNKIFASLQEDGKGGDIMQDDEYFGISKYKDCQFVVEYEDCIDNIDNGNFEVIGIQQ